ncbi:MAG: hypothetical protein ACYS47_09020 [Planctomycetota bacterium]
MTMARIPFPTRTVPILLLTALSLFPLRARGESEPTLQERIGGLSRDLEDPSWAVRKRATRALIDYGDAVLPHAFRLLASPDPEVRSRAATVVLSFRESPLILREAFRAGPTGMRWAFRTAAEADARLPVRRRVHLENAVRAGGFYGTEACIPFVIDGLIRGVPGAEDALALLGAPEPCFRECRRRYDPALADRILPALGLTGGKAAEAFLRDLAREGNPTEKRAARVALKRVEATKRVHRTADALLHGSALARREARRRLRSEPTGFRNRVADLTLRAATDREPEEVLEGLDAPWVWEGVDPRILSFRRGRRLLDGWIRRLQGTPAPMRASWIFRVLAEYPWVVPAVEACVVWTGRAKTSESWETLEVLGGFVAGPLARHVTTSERSPSPGWAELLLSMEGVPPMEALETILLRARWNVAARAARALAERGGERAVEALLQGAEKRRIRRNCIEALSLLGGDVGFERLSAFLTPFPAPELIVGLGRTEDLRAARILLGALRSNRLAGAALRGLGHLGEASFLPILTRAAVGDRTWKPALEGLANLGDEKTLPFLDRYSRACRALGLRDRARLARTAMETIRGRR